MAKADSKDVVVLDIRTTRKQGFRRAGLAITREGITVRKDSLTKDQIKALEGEPMILVSERIEAVAAADDKK